MRIAKILEKIAHPVLYFVFPVASRHIVECFYSFWGKKL